ncbi:MAG: porin family protein [Rhodobacteraceae bacterium]|nr:porin family protein [Paracoccaceae bacterium]
MSASIKSICAPALALALLSAPAFAGGLTAAVGEPAVEPSAAPAVGGDWTGAWVGLNIGSIKSNAKETNPADAFNESHHGTSYGIAAGYDFDLGNWVVGGALSWNKGKMDVVKADPTDPTEVTVKLDNIKRLSVRAGYDLGPALVYASLGTGRVTLSGNGEKASQNIKSIGLGVDYKLSDSWVVGGQILRDQYKDGTESLKFTTASINIGMRF